MLDAGAQTQRLRLLAPGLLERACSNVFRREIDRARSLCAQLMKKGAKDPTLLSVDMQLKFNVLCNGYTGRDKLSEAELLASACLSLHAASDEAP